MRLISYVIKDIDRVIGGIESYNLGNHIEVRNVDMKLSHYDIIFQ